MKLPAKETKGILTVHRRGSEASPTTPVLIMIAGFPDSNGTWDTLAPLFEEQKYHVVTMAYPGIDPADVPRLERERRWGYDLDAVVAALLQLIQEYREMGCTTVFLLGHDWGSFPVLRVAHDYPTAITAVVSEDIGIVAPIYSLRLKSILVILGYQWLFVTIFIVTRLLPVGMGNWFCQTALWLYPWRLIGPVALPTTSASAFGRPPWTLHYPYQMHPYFHLYKNIITKGQVNPVRFTKVPLLYIYGRQKRVMFHTPKYLQRLEQAHNCRHICYEDAGHWIHTTHPERMARDMLDFFKGLSTTAATQR